MQKIKHSNNNSSLSLRQAALQYPVALKRFNLEPSSLPPPRRCRPSFIPSPPLPPPHPPAHHHHHPVDCTFLSSGVCLMGGGGGGRNCLVSGSNVSWTPLIRKFPPSASMTKLEHNAEFRIGSLQWRPPWAIQQWHSQGYSRLSNRSLAVNTRHPISTCPHPPPPPPSFAPPLSHPILLTANCAIKTTLSDFPSSEYHSDQYDHHHDTFMTRQISSHQYFSSQKISCREDWPGTSKTCHTSTRCQYYRITGKIHVRWDYKQLKTHADCTVVFVVVCCCCFFCFVFCCCFLLLLFCVCVCSSLFSHFRRSL